MIPPTTTLRALLEREAFAHRMAHKVRDVRRECEANPSRCAKKAKFNEVLRSSGVPPAFFPAASATSISHLLGYQRWCAMMNMFATQKFLVPLEYQIRFRTVMMHTLLPVIYSENGEWARYRELICAFHLKGERYVPYAAMICARQVGKSTIVANTLLGIILHVPNQEIMVISITARQSTLLGETLHNQLGLALGARADSFIVRKTDEKWVFRNGTTVFFAPASPKGVRGVRVTCLIADEACFMRDVDAGVTVLPFMSFDGLPMVFLSSPSPVENFVRRLIDYRDPVTGLPKCHTVQVRQVCRACLSDGLVQCNHVRAAEPPWKSNAQDMKFLSSVYNSSAGGYELGGIDDISKHPAFAPQVVAALRDALDYKLTAPPIAAMLAIDPCGGGSQSDCAIVLSAVVRDPPTSATPGKLRILVLGGASVSLTTGTNEVMYEVISMLVRTMRRTRFMDKTRVAIVIEANLSQLGAMAIAKHVQRIGDPNIVLMSETRVNTKNERVNGPYVYLDGNRGKERYVATLDAMMRTETIRFAENMIVHSNRHVPTPEDMANARRLFRARMVEQLYNFGVVIRPRADGTSTRVFSGKGAGSGKDDLAMALMMSVWQIIIYVALDTYTTVRGTPVLNILAVHQGAHEAHVSIARDALAGDLASNVVRRPWDPMHPDARSTARGMREDGNE